MTELIARIAGPYLLLTGLGFAISRDFYQRMVMGNAQADPILLNLSGAVHFIVGLIVLNNHFRWSGFADCRQLDRHRCRCKRGGADRRAGDDTADPQDNRQGPYRKYGRLYPGRGISVLRRVSAPFGEIT